MIFQYLPSISKTTGFIGAIIIIILVGISRLYLGAHSLNQIILGIFLGLFMNCLYYICGLDLQITEMLENFNTEPRLGWKKYIILFHGLYFLAYFYADTHIEKNIH